MITENLSTFKIHKLTQEQYNRELLAGNLEDNALYLTPDEEIDLSGYATIKQLDGKANSSHNHIASDITSGTLSSDRLPIIPISKGGTGATTVDDVLVNLGITKKYLHQIVIKKSNYDCFSFSIITNTSDNISNDYSTLCTTIVNTVGANKPIPASGAVGNFNDVNCSFPVYAIYCPHVGSLSYYSFKGSGLILSADFNSANITEIVTSLI